MGLPGWEKVARGRGNAGSFKAASGDLVFAPAEVVAEFVDDDQDARVLMRSLLERDGYEAFRVPA